jgi:hypothetical protein
MTKTEASGWAPSVALALAALFTAEPGAAGQTISDFAQNVTRHVLLHEVGHAAMREFGLPVLANEEAMADSFATFVATQLLRDAAAEIVTARVRSWMIEDGEVDRADYDMMGEHDLDIRRAYQTACLLYGADPTEWADDVAWIGYSPQDLSDCADTAPDQIEGWIQILTPHLRPDGQPSTHVEVVYGEGPLREAMLATGVMEEIADLARRLDWPEPIRLHFDHCDRRASWSRNERRVLLCDSYVERFIRQGQDNLAN